MSGTPTGNATQPLPPHRVWFHRVALLAGVIAVLLGVPVIAMIPVGVAVVAAMPRPTVGRSSASDGAPRDEHVRSPFCPPA